MKDCTEGELKEDRRGLVWRAIELVGSEVVIVDEDGNRKQTSGWWDKNRYFPVRTKQEGFDL